MSAVALQSSAGAEPGLANLESLRTHTGVDLELTHENGGTSPASLFEYGGSRLRFVRSANLSEAVLINTAGGLAGGDHLKLRIDARKETHCRLTSPAMEKIYRTLDQPVKIDVELNLDAHCRFHWLPQGLIFYSGAQLDRHFTVNVKETSEFLLMESLIFGRSGMGERVESGCFSDKWRIVREKQLIFAENTHLHGAIADQLDRTAIGGGHSCFSTFLLVSPQAEERLEAIRRALEETRSKSAASAWNGLLLVRLLARNSLQMVNDITVIMEKLTGQVPPRSWQS